MQDLAMHILELLMNSIHANSFNIYLTVKNSIKENLIEIILIDDGKGMDEKTLNNVTSPFSTSRTTRKIGLGVAFMKALCDQCNGTLVITSEINKGTKETRNLDLLISNDITALISQDDLETEFTPEIEINDNLSAPIAQGQVVGKIIYNIDGIEYSADLTASHSVEKSRYVKLIIQILMIILILFFLYKLLFENHPKKKYYQTKNNRKK